jgi:hypothetical protein
MLIKLNGGDELLASNALHLGCGIDHLLQAVEQLQVLVGYFYKALVIMRVSNIQLVIFWLIRMLVAVEVLRIPQEERLSISNILM